MSQILVVVPTYNERENIELLIQSLFDIFPHLSLLIVDDNSPDGTAGAVEKLMKKRENIHLLRRKNRKGLGLAYRDGFRWALERDYRYIVQMDGDLSHNPKYIKDFLVAIKKSDLVIGSRYLDQSSFFGFGFGFFRSPLSLLASYYIRIAIKIPIRDPMSGFKCFSRRALEAIDLDSFSSRGYVFQLEMNMKIREKGLHWLEIPIDFRHREKGVSKMNLKIILEAFFFVLGKFFKS